MTEIAYARNAIRIGLAALFALACSIAPAFAHPGHIPMDGFAAGLMHPLSGLDHMLAMVAVGLWAGAAPGKRVWLWPLTFVSSMAIGGAVGIGGVSLWTPEPMIFTSIVVLGAAIATRVRVSACIGALLIALFGFSHGYAHGVEMPRNISGADFAIGFTLATAALHAAGLIISLTLRKVGMAALMRAAGLAIAVAGVTLIFGG